jgi:Trk K+ transport system NAD-binding subunit
VAVLGSDRQPHGVAAVPRLFEMRVPDAASVVGKALAELDLPAAALVVAVVRGGVHLVARGPTRLERADVVIVFATGEDAQVVERVLTTPAS